MKVLRQLYLTIAGYGCTLEETEEDGFTATCEPMTGTRLSVKAPTLETVKVSLEYAIRDYEAQMLDKETTLQEIPTEDDRAKN